MNELWQKKKAEHGDALLLFRIGNVYEAYYGDAEILDRLYGSNGKGRHTVPAYNIFKVIEQVWLEENLDALIVTEEHVPGSDTCVICGADVPEGRQVCARCEYESK